MGYTKIDELSTSLKEYIANLGLTEEQVNELIQNVTGDMSTLKTTNKTVAGAINELFQNANNGKALIAAAIGKPLLSTDTFSAMSGKINTIKENLKTVLSDEGVTVSAGDDMSTLITKVDTEFDSNRNRLYILMLEGGYEVTSNMNIDDMIDLLELSGISYGEIKQIVCGYRHTFILKTNNTLWSCGYNNTGQLGLGDTIIRKTFTQVTTNINNDVKQIVCGNDHTFILKNDGSIWACGYNDNYGQLGLGESTNKSTFTKVTDNINNDVKQIVCGYFHTSILKNDGNVWSCGYNTDGQLGSGDTTNKSTFTKVQRGF